MSFAEKIRSTIVISILGAALASAATAQPRSPQMLAAKFQAADTNHDGKLTLEEAKAGMPRVAEAFDKIDVEKKGYLTLEQVQAFAAKP
ncbi:MAG: hand family protein [Gammaproteobacteria bacterium]|nr:hand family protein [Gammaproteobacteria bacterium]